MSVVKIIQKRSRPSGSTYLGTGKAEEVGQIAAEMKADAVIINGMLKGNQIYNLAQKIKCPIYDRVDVILNIFDRHATTAEAKLQIKRARAETLFERERGGRGTIVRGAGESGIEAEKRHIKEQIRKIDEKIAEMRNTQKNQRDRRKRQGLLTAAIVGYTNAGKSALMRTLTGKNIIVADKLFATLDTRMGDIWLPLLQKKILIADTIGFIQDLPPQLIAAFKSTLEEAIESNILLHVFDASNSATDQKRKHKTVMNILRELGCKQPILQIGNKIDLLSPEKLEKLNRKNSVILVSAEKKIGLEKLIGALEKIPCAKKNKS